MISNEKNKKISLKLFIFFATFLISGIAAKMVYVLYVLCLMALVSGGSTVSFIIFVLGVGLSIFTWIMCFRWLYAYFKKEFLST